MSPEISMNCMGKAWEAGGIVFRSVFVEATLVAKFSIFSMIHASSIIGCQTRLGVRSVLWINEPLSVLSADI